MVVRVIWAMFSALWTPRGTLKKIPPVVTFKKVKSLSEDSLLDAFP